MKLTFNDTDVAKVNEQAHLGIILDSTLSFDKRLNEKIIQAKKNVGMLTVNDRLSAATRISAAVK